MNPIPFRRSKQIRNIPIGETIKVKMVKVFPGMNFILKEIIIDTFSEQADQDLVCLLKNGNSILTRLGKFQISNDPSDPDFPTESRPENTEGSFFSEISSSNGSGTPDNFEFTACSYPSLYLENTEIIFEVKNQSAVYNHPVILGISGFFIGKK